LKAKLFLYKELENGLKRKSPAESVCAEVAVKDMTVF